MLDPTELLSRKLLLVTGKGGIGKTVLTACLGQLAAAAGKRVLLVEYVACDQLAPLFGATLIGHSERSVAPNIDCLNLDPTENFREYMTKYLGQRVLYDTIFSHKVVQSFIKTVPGLAELMLLGRLYYHCELAPEPRYDLVILDGFASGHFLSLMTTPAAVLHTALGGPLIRETERVSAFLADRDKCGIVYVTIPEALVISETLDFLPRLAAQSPTAIAGVVINRTPPPLSTLSLPGPAADYLARIAESAAAATAMLTEGLAVMTPHDSSPMPIWTLPEVGFIPEPLPADFAAKIFTAQGQDKAERAKQ